MATSGNAMSEAAHTVCNKDIYRSIVQSTGAADFKAPVSKEDFPDYGTVIEHPMCLNDVKVRRRCGLA